MVALASELHSETHSQILVAGTCRPLSSVPFLGKTCRWSCSEEADDSALAARCDDILPPVALTHFYVPTAAAWRSLYCGRPRYLHTTIVCRVTRPQESLAKTDVHNSFGGKYWGEGQTEKHMRTCLECEGSFGFWVWTCTMTGLTAGRD